mmetsp:Transcript_7536/g.10973  ORF Transcript_7536/g.10973 Transcript_7536/m.10973 type:complete len:209 (+) Transcript_7536:424-1050(+)
MQLLMVLKNFYKRCEEACPNLDLLSSRRLAPFLTGVTQPLQQVSTHIRCGGAICKNDFPYPPRQGISPQAAKSFRGRLFVCKQYAEVSIQTYFLFLAASGHFSNRSDTTSNDAFSLHAMWSGVSSNGFTSIPSSGHFSNSNDNTSRDALKRHAIWRTDLPMPKISLGAPCAGPMQLLHFSFIASGYAMRTTSTTFGDAPSATTMCKGK